MLNFALLEIILTHDKQLSRIIKAGHVDIFKEIFNLNYLQTFLVVVRANTN